MNKRLDIAFLPHLLCGASEPHAGPPWLTLRLKLPRLSSIPLVWVRVLRREKAEKGLDLREPCGEPGASRESRRGDGEAPEFGGNCWRGWILCVTWGIRPGCESGHMPEFLSPPCCEKHTGTSETTSLTTPFYKDGTPRPRMAMILTVAHVRLGLEGAGERGQDQITAGLMETD